MKILQSYFLLILIFLSNAIFAQSITLSSGQIAIPTLKQINQDWSFYRQNNAPDKFYFKQALRVRKRDDEREASKAVASNYQSNKEKTLLRNRHFRNVLALMNNQNFQSELSKIQYFYEQNRFDKKVQIP